MARKLGLLLTSYVFDLTYAVKVFETSEDSGECKTGLLSLSLKVLPDGPCGLRLNVLGYTLTFIMHGKAKISIFLFCCLMKRCSQLC